MWIVVALLTKWDKRRYLFFYYLCIYFFYFHIQFDCEINLSKNSCFSNEFLSFKFKLKIVCNCKFVELNERRSALPSHVSIKWIKLYIPLECIKILFLISHVKIIMLNSAQDKLTPGRTRSLYTYLFFSNALCNYNHRLRKSSKQNGRVSTLFFFSTQNHKSFWIESQNEQR